MTDDATGWNEGDGIENGNGISELKNGNGNGINELKNGNGNGINELSNEWSFEINKNQQQEAKKDGNFSSKTKEFIEKSGKNAITLLFELCQREGIGTPEITYLFDGNVHCPAFRARMKFARLDLSFNGNQCFTKRDAKASCCLNALNYFLTRNGSVVNEPSTSTAFNVNNGIIRSCEEKSYTMFERFAATISAHVAAKCQTYGHIEGSDKVRAGIFMVDAHAKQCFLISWATGSKCIRGNCLDLHGQVVNDCHAEILCRRGLLRFLYQQIKVFKRNEAVSIFVARNGKLAVRPNLSFHLFVNTAPCGDGRVFAFSSEEDDRSGSFHHPKYGKNMGLCRSKIEMGEGTVLIPDVVQTYDGIQGFERLRTMSCSDKILKWNILGLQGCLLSSLMQPLYLSSISIDHLFHFAHLSRSLCCRLGGYVVPRPFLLHHPYLATCYKTVPLRNSTKTSSLATNWNISDGVIEIIDAQTGQIQNTCKSSRLCKRNMFQSYCSAVKLLSGESSSNAIPILSSSYLEAKIACKDYMQARDHFFQALLDSGAGKWLKKPMEEKMFYITN